MYKMPIDDALENLKLIDEVNELKEITNEKDKKIAFLKERIKYHELFEQQYIRERFKQLKEGTASSIKFPPAEHLPTEYIIETINETKKALAEQIRKYCESQKEIWQQIPFWGLELTIRQGCRSTSSYWETYESGYLALDEKYHTLVDLESGELIQFDYPDSSKAIRKPANEFCVLELTNNLDLINAQKVLDVIKERVKAYSPDVDPRNIAWREEQRKKYNVEKIYKRTKVKEHAN